MNHAAPTVIGNKLDSKDLSFLMETLSHLEDYRGVLRDTCKRMQVILANLFGVSGQEIMLMQRNKYGMSKEEAKKIYYKFRGGDPESGEQPDEPGSSDKEPESNEEKISMIMDYMKETSHKLDQIEEDISYLKEQVDKILKKL